MRLDEVLVRRLCYSVFLSRQISEQYFWKKKTGYGTPARGTMRLHSDDDAWGKGRGIATKDPHVAGSLDSPFFGFSVKRKGQASFLSKTLLFDY
jgi:hypothetical protein